MFRLQEAENGGSRLLTDTGTHTLYYMASQPDLKEYYAVSFSIHCTSLISDILLIFQTARNTQMYIRVWKVHSK
jgi:hypothetical protein